MLFILCFLSSGCQCRISSGCNDLHCSWYNTWQLCTLQILGPQAIILALTDIYLKNSSISFLCKPWFEVFVIIDCSVVRLHLSICCWIIRQWRNCHLLHAADICLVDQVCEDWLTILVNLVCSGLLLHGKVTHFNLLFLIGTVCINASSRKHSTWNYCLVTASKLFSEFVLIRRNVWQSIKEDV